MAEEFFADFFPPQSYVRVQQHRKGENDTSTSFLSPTNGSAYGMCG